MKTAFNVENQEQKALAESIHVGTLCRVEAFYPAKMTVDVQPLSMRPFTLRTGGGQCPLSGKVLIWIPSIPLRPFPDPPDYGVQASICWQGPTMRILPVFRSSWRCLVSEKSTFRKSVLWR